MTRFFIWTLLAIIIMLVCPWLATKVPGITGMAVCLILFFVVNPVFSAFCGLSAGKDIRRLWPLPIITAALFLTGAWGLIEFGESAFLLYCGAYLMIGLIAMLISGFRKKRE